MVCPICGKLYCDHSPTERGQSTEEMITDSVFPHKLINNKTIKLTKKLRGLPNTAADFDWSKLFMITMAVPYECNYHCLKCAFTESKSKQHLPLDRKVRIVEEAAELGARLLLIEGEGEPFLSNELKPLVSTANRKGLTSLVFTNGSVFNKDNISFCYDHDVSLIVSLDSLDEDTYNLLTQTREQLPKVLENLNQLRRHYAPSLRRVEDKIITRLALTSLISLQNRGQLRELSDFCGEDMLYLCNTPLYEGTARDNWEVLTGISPTTEHTNIHNSKFKELKEKYTQGPLQILRRNMGGCALLQNGIELTSDGRVLLCAGARSIQLGDTRSESLSEIWKKKKKFLSQYDLSEITCFPREKPELYQELIGVKHD